MAKKSLRSVSHADGDKLNFTGGQFYASRHFMLMRFHIVCISSKQGNVKVIDRDSKNHSLIQSYKFLDIRSRFKLSTYKIVILLVLDSCTKICLCFNLSFLRNV